MNKEQLETERLYLRKLTSETFKHIFQSMTNNEIKDFLGLNSDEELEKERFKSAGGYVTHDRTICGFTMVLKSSGETIGRCGYHNWYAQHSRAELGYAMSKDKYKRQGYMSEAVERILEYGFNDLNLNRIEAFVAPDNNASLRLIRKYHFEEEGYLKEHYNYENNLQDSIVFGLLKKKYNQEKERGNFAHSD